MTDINVNALAEAINDKMDRDGSNIASPKLPIFLVAVQYPTAENNYTWYRLYSDGWVEQGGVGRTGSTYGRITLPIEMANTHYTVTTSPNGTSGNYSISINNITTTGFMQNNSATDVTDQSWRVSGMAAQQ